MSGRQRGLALAAGVFLLVASPFLPEAPERTVAVGQDAPAVVLPRLDGRPYATAALAGQVVVLNFWATWCAPCIEELPSLERLHRALSAEGLTVVAIATDESRSTVARFVESRRLTLTVLQDPGGRAAARAFGVHGYPETWILGRDGRVVHRAQGPAVWDAPEAQAYFRGLLLAGPGGDPPQTSAPQSRSTSPTR